MGVGVSAARVAAGTVITVILVAVLVLVGWWLDVAALRSVGPGLVAMNPATALAFMLAGVSLWLQRHEKVPLAGRRFALWLAALVVVAGLLRLVGYALRLDLGVDSWLFRSRLEALAPGPPNRMAPNTAAAFVLLGSALFLLDARSLRGQRWARGLALAVLLVSLLALSGYAYGTRSLYGVGPFIPMALNTALCFGFLAVGLLCARPGRGVMALLSGSAPGSVLARLLLPPALALPVALGWLKLGGERLGWFDAAGGLAVMVALMVVALAALIWWSAGSLNRADAERRRAERDVIELNRTLEQSASRLTAANQDLEAFSYSVSHDLRAPVRHVASFAELLERSSADALNEQGRRHLATIRDSARRMGQMIDDLLAFSRLGRAELHAGPAPLSAVVDGARSDLKHEVGGRDIRWTVGPLPTVRGDRALLQMAFVNLLDNALKYTASRQPAEIAVEGWVTGGEAVVAVRDNGVGFDMRYADKLFGVFQRLHSGEEFEGMGIGLANVRRIVQRHGGRVWAEGEPGRGATFYVALPLAGVESAA